MSVPKFDKKELEIVGTYPAVGTYYGMPSEPTMKLNYPISPRENLKLHYARKQAYWMPEGVREVDVVYPDIVPDCVACGYEGGLDSFGVEWIPVENNPELPAFVKPGVAKLEDITLWRNLEFPQVDTWDWEGSARLYSELSDEKFRMGVVLSGFFERLISLMTFEGAAMAMIEDPEETAEFMQALADYNISLIEHYKKYYNVDAVVIHDDWGAQRAPFFSRALLQEVIVPAYKRVVTRAHELGVVVVTHCCGCSEGFVPDMIEIGSDMWELQLDANPNIMETIAKYRDRIFFEIWAPVLDVSSLEGYRACTEEIYRTYGKEGVLIYPMDVTFSFNPEFDNINYECARKAMSGEL